MNARHSLMLGLLTLLGLSACGSGGHDVVLSSSTMPSHLQPNNNKPQSKPNGSQPSNGNNNPFKPSQGSGGTGTANPSNPSNGGGTGTANPSNPSNGGGTGTANPSNPSNSGGTGTANPSNPSNGGGTGTTNPSNPSNGSGAGTANPSNPSNGSGTGTSNPSNPSNGGGTGTANPSNPSNGSGTGTANPSNPSNGGGAGTANPSNPSNGSGTGTSNPSNPSNGGGTGTANPSNPSNGGGTGTTNPSNPSNGGGTGTANPSNPSNGGGTGTANPSNPSNGGGAGTANPSNPSNGGGTGTANPSNPPSSGGTGTSTPSTPSAFQVTPPAAAQKAEIDKAVANTNKLRAEKGLPALQYDPNLSAYAQKRAEEIVKLFSHTRPDGQSWSTGVKGGYSGENIAAGSATADKTVLDQWRNSSGHYANMINSNYTRIGIGLVYVPNSQYGYYWVQIFGSDSTTSNYRFTNQNNMMRSALMIPVKRDAIAALTTLKIDGRTLPLTISGNSDWHTIKAQGYTGEFGGNTVFSRYGVVKAENEGQYRSFHQGLPTALADMPQAGKIRYQGQGIAAQGVEKRYLQANFTADFDRKTLNGSLSNAQQRFGIDAMIRGNTFVSPIGAKVATQGGFFGVNAAEVSGTFDDRQGTQGAFGATRR